MGGVGASCQLSPGKDVQELVRARGLFVSTAENLRGAKNSAIQDKQYFSAMFSFPKRNIRDEYQNSK